MTPIALILVVLNGGSAPAVLEVGRFPDLPKCEKAAAEAKQAGPSPSLNIQFICVGVGDRP